MLSKKISQKPWLGWLIFGLTIALVFLIGIFASSIMERRSEAKLATKNLKPIADWEPRNEVWGENYPREFETYKSTEDTTFRSQYAGNGTIDLLEKDPRLVVLWAGYAFSRDYNQARGHQYAVNDIRKTLRTGVPQPATCWSCKSPDVPRMMQAKGVGEFYRSKWADLGSEVVNNIGCSDCHDNKTMNLRISRPALAEAYQRMGKDIKQATHQEMRSLVCAQCHVEYYFKGKEDKYLTFPWDKGFSAEDMEKYYDEVQHVDFVHTLSKAPILKAQHPDFELYKTGIHAERGVACADCHMPYRSEGGVKFTDHKVQSPLNNIANSCGVCHRQSEETLRNNVYSRQDKIRELLEIVETALVASHVEAKAAWDAGADSVSMAPALKMIRHAQWRWDWVAAANGFGFHSPLEAARVLGTAIQKAEGARSLIGRVLLRLGKPEPVPYPDIATKDKAQQFIGLKMDSLRTKKMDFIQNTLPQWDKMAQERQSKMPK